MSHFRSLLVKHPLRVALLVTIVVAMVATSAFAYWLSPPHMSGPKASTVSSPLEFTIELDKAGFQQGENVTMRLSLKNISNKTITVTWWNRQAMGMYFDFCILDENGTAIYSWTTGRLSMPAVNVKTLSPNEELVSVCNWEQNYDSPSTTPVPKGSYSVKGLSRVFELAADGQTLRMTLETPTIAFSIT